MASSSRLRPCNGLELLSENLTEFVNPFSLTRSGNFHPPIPAESVGSPQCRTSPILPSPTLSTAIRSASRSRGICFRFVFRPIEMSVVSHSIPNCRLMRSFSAVGSGLNTSRIDAVINHRSCIVEVSVEIRESHVLIDGSVRSVGLHEVLHLLTPEVRHP